MLFDFRENDFFNLDEGFKKGNMFKNIYSPYKNYKVSDLKMIDEDYKLDFAINDLELYLLTNPNDNEAKELLNKYMRMKDHKERYYV